MWDPPNILKTQYQFILEICYKYLYEQHLIVLKTSRDNLFGFLTGNPLELRVTYSENSKKNSKKNSNLNDMKTGISTWRCFESRTTGRKEVSRVVLWRFLTQRYSVIANSSCPSASQLVVFQDPFPC